MRIDMRARVNYDGGVGMGVFVRVLTRMKRMWGSMKMNTATSCKYSALDVADWFLVRNKQAMVEEDAEPMSNMKLQKLLYYAQGAHLALYREPLFGEDLVAWRHGPVVPEVYHRFKEFGSAGIELEHDVDTDQFDDQTNQTLEQVYVNFGQFSAWKLREMTHQETPWRSTEQSQVIGIDSIEDYFVANYLED
jgi:uncharacterized phage-associated protein